MGTGGRVKESSVSDIETHSGEVITLEIIIELM